MGRLSSFSRALLIVAYVGLMVGCVGWRPSMDTVLWGKMFEQVREDAIARTRKQVAWDLDVAGVDRLGDGVYISCEEGQNNWKVQEKYRLRCQAQAPVYYGWRGEFEPTASRILDRFRIRCGKPPWETPRPFSTTAFMNAECAPSDRLLGLWVLPEGLPGHLRAYQEPADRDQRRIEWNDPLGAVSAEQYDWFMIVSIENLIYEDYHA
ncbi:MAG: hypothetical protein Q3997_08620 [Propionibacteriaceae bacterium]|nr:hypothetical protein [Propionibacteriaceae bacterium]